ncbi:hypothetical protein [Alcanivorax sp. 1008]|uniref:hypothetical protein n=1 Tax=Alcanivorax sp. 1008 TaxID=2816853 RepID=UPI001D2083FE|nr:hypothetical protein [Alcanivorax sp. 1008]MCC1495448.1 hypothetical protein [Alcanivorax sp. 1008]
MKKFLIMLLVTFPLALHAEQEQQKVKDPAITQMETLASNGIQQALQLLQKSGRFYPFALVYNEANEQVEVVGYRGDPKARPKAEDFAVALFLEVRQLAENNSDVSTAVVLKPFQATSKDGEVIFGVWAAVDHRRRGPWLMFQPLIEQKPGHYALGELVYQKSEEAIFPPLATK